MILMSLNVLSKNSCLSLVGKDIGLAKPSKKKMGANFRKVDFLTTMANGGLICVVRDITERKQIEYELRTSEINFCHSLDDSPLGVRISSIEGETIYANRAILDVYGYDSIEELKKISLKERYTPESYAEFLLRKEKRLRGELGPSEYEISIVRKKRRNSPSACFSQENILGR